MLVSLGCCLQGRRVRATREDHRVGWLKITRVVELGSEASTSSPSATLPFSSTRTTNTQWPMKAEGAEWKKGEELTASAKGCPEKLLLNGEDVQRLASSHRLPVEEGSSFEGIKQEEERARTRVNFLFSITAACVDCTLIFVTLRNNTVQQYT